MIIKESAENYLETVLILKKKNGHVRSVDIATSLGFSKASVSVAERMYERHHVLADLLIRLGVTEDVAYEDSCKIEHYLSQESFDKIKEYMQK